MLFHLMSEEFRAEIERKHFAGNLRHWELQLCALAFLTVFGNGQNPQLNLAGHCDPNSNGCTGLGDEIKHYKDKGIQVFLSIGGASGSYTLSSSDDSKGDAIVDGIDFDIENGGTEHYDDLASELAGSSTERKVLLAAAPQCPYPDAHFDSSIATGLFDYVWVQFYNNPCEQQKSWTSYVPPNNTVFLGLPAAPDAAPIGGYIPSNVLPFVKQASNYGAVISWDRVRDVRGPIR
ncbi:unnamed protein product [Sphenostylis stenocarpa]|uniref:chitinase n=1 Tax=Sphenostylis stenocarpa TaxID=92480 RepID=A0AA86W209_9FABA|nr:unnamed protein product [Sphenostylis stenocarpa]